MYQSPCNRDIPYLLPLLSRGILLNDKTFSINYFEYTLWSPWSNSAEMYRRPAKQHQLVERVWRHVAKRLKAVFDYDKCIIEKDDKRVRRNKRMRQTYFEASHKSSKPSSATKAQTNKIKKKKYMNMTIDMFFPIKEMDENLEELKKIWIKSLSCLTQNYLLQKKFIYFFVNFLLILILSFLYFCFFIFYMYFYFLFLLFILFNNILYFTLAI